MKESSNTKGDQTAKGRQIFRPAVRRITPTKSTAPSSQSQSLVKGLNWSRIWKAVQVFGVVLGIFGILAGAVRLVSTSIIAHDVDHDKQKQEIKQLQKSNTELKDENKKLSETVQQQQSNQRYIEGKLDGFILGIMHEGVGVSEIKDVGLLPQTTDKTFSESLPRTLSSHEELDKAMKDSLDSIFQTAYRLGKRSNLELRGKFDIVWEIDENGKSVHASVQSRTVPGLSELVKIIRLQMLAKTFPYNGERYPYKKTINVR